jgi:hypothetical protein
MGNKNTNWRNPIKNVDYVVITEFSDEIQIEFEKWLEGKTRPMVEKEAENMMRCAFYSDWEKFNQIL